MNPRLDSAPFKTYLQLKIVKLTLNRIKIILTYGVNRTVVIRYFSLLVRWFASFGGSDGTVVTLYFSSLVRWFASFGGKNRTVVILYFSSLVR